MVISNHRLCTVALALAMTALASPGYAQSGHDMSPGRAAAIHECSVLADQYPEYDWGNTEIYQYRACMAEHGEQE
jgi:hypothetical protein